MNRFQLVQVIIITVALCLGYNCVNSFCWFLNQSISSFWADTSVISNYAMMNGLMALFFAISFFWILNKTTTIANWILAKTDLDPEVKLNLGVSTFLLGIIVFLGLKTIFESGAEIITYMISSFYSASSKINKWESVQQPSIIVSFIKFIAAFFLLRYSKLLSEYFEKRTDEHDPHQIFGDVEPDEVA